MTSTSASAPFTYRIDRARGIVFLEYGQIQPSATEWCAVMDELVADPDFRPGLPFVSDRRRLGEAPTTNTLRAMAEYVGKRRDDFGPARWAIVTGTPAEYGMVRMGEVLFGSAGSLIHLRPFTDMDEATAWATGTERA
jgi:hypothetical protein